MIKEGLGDKSISYGLLAWHLRNLYPLRHHTVIRFQIVEGMPFFIKPDQGNSEMEEERRPVFRSSHTNAFSERKNLERNSYEC